MSKELEFDKYLIQKRAKQLASSRAHLRLDLRGNLCNFMGRFRIFTALLDYKNMLGLSWVSEIVGAF